MATLATLKARIADELARTDLTSQIVYAIDDAIRHYETYPWWFLEAESSSSTADGTAAYALPADFSRIVAATVTESGRRYPLTAITYEEYRSKQIEETVTKSRPDEYALWAEQISLYPTPDAVYTLKVNYTKALGAPATDDASNEWTTECEPLIRARAKRELYLHVIRDYEEAAACAADEQQWFVRLYHRSYLQGGSGEIVPQYL